MGFKINDKIVFIHAKNNFSCDKIKFIVDNYNFKIEKIISFMQEPISFLTKYFS